MNAIKVAVKSNNKPCIQDELANEFEEHESTISETFEEREYQLKEVDVLDEVKHDNQA